MLDDLWAFFRFWWREIAAGLGIIALLIAVQVLTGCGAAPQPIRQGTAQAVAVEAQVEVAAAVTRAASLHEQADAAAVTAAALAAEAQALHAAGKDATDAQIQASRAEGVAKALAESATKADARAADARHAAERAAKDAAKEHDAEVEAERLTRVRSRCELIAGCLALAALVGGAALAYLATPRLAALVVGGGLILAGAVVLAGASLPWLYAAAPWVLLAVAIAGAAGLVWCARHAADLRQIVAADSHADLPRRLSDLAARHGWPIPPAAPLRSSPIPMSPDQPSPADIPGCITVSVPQGTPPN